MTECKPAKTLLQLGLDLCEDESSDSTDETRYRQLIASLLHLSDSVRPDISYAARYLSRFV